MRRVLIAGTLILALLGAFAFKVLAGGAQSGLGNAGALLGTYSGHNSPNGVAWSGGPAHPHFDDNNYSPGYFGPSGMGGFGDYSFAGGGVSTGAAATQGGTSGTNGGSNTGNNTGSNTGNNTGNQYVGILTVNFVKTSNGAGSSSGDGTGKVQAPEPVSCMLFLLGGGGLFLRRKVAFFLAK